MTVFRFDRVMDHQVRVQFDLRETSWEGSCVRVAITSILGRLLVRAGDTGTIPFSYRDGCRNGAHRYDHNLANADTSGGPPAVQRRGWGRLSHVLCQFLGAGLVPRSVKFME